MKSKSKVWLGIGVFVVAGSGAVGAGAPLVLDTAAVRGLQTRSATDTAIPRAAGVVVAQHADHAKADPAKADPAKADPAKAGGEGGESKGIANLPPELAFGVKIALLRGHLL